MEQKGGDRMKCQKCNGSGVDDDRLICYRCGGSGVIEMTNEEYLHSCNTEQVADVFFEYRYVNATPRQKLWMSASEECIKTDIVEWLKQPHKE